MNSPAYSGAEKICGTCSRSCGNALFGMPCPLIRYNVKALTFCGKPDEDEILAVCKECVYSEELNGVLLRDSEYCADCPVKDYLI